MLKSIKCDTCKVGSCAIETLSTQEIHMMETQTYQTEFQKGEIVRKQDTPFESIIYLRNGYVKEFVSHQNVADQIVQIIKPRSYIGMQVLFTNTKSVYSYQAITDVEVCFIDRNLFNILIDGNGRFAREIIKALSGEFLSNHQRILNLNQTQIYGKVAGLLIYLAEEVFENHEFSLMLKRVELAEMISSTRESVTRSLLWFHKEGIISMDKNKIHIKDFNRLSELAKRG